MTTQIGLLKRRAVRPNAGARRTQGMAVAVLIASVALTGGAMAAPARDCAKAAQEIDQVICKDTSLAALERKLTARFDGAHRNLSNEQIETLKSEQAAFINARSECLKAADKRACVHGLTQRRIVELEARYGQARVGKSVYFSCAGAPAEEVIFTPVATKPASANLVRGDEVFTVMRTAGKPAGTYDGDLGLKLTRAGKKLSITWPQGQVANCTAR